jgi:hypothetical protein
MRRLIRGLVTEAAANGEVRDDVGPDELTDYCLHALTAADRAMSRAAVGRVVDLTLEGLSPPRRRGRLRARPI